MCHLLTFFMPLVMNLSTLSSPSFMASRTAALCSSERFLNSKVLPGPDADTRESGPDILVLWRRWDELEGGVQILEEVCLDPLRGGREEIDLRRDGRRGVFEDGGKELGP